MAAAAQEVRSYCLDPAAFEPALRRRIRRRLGWGLAWVVGVLVPMIALLAQFQQGILVTLPFTIPLLIASIAVGGVRALRRERTAGRAAWEAYQLTLSPNAMRRFLPNLSAVEIVRPEVTRIVDSPGDGLTVTTADAHRFIFIPEQLIEFASVRAQLAEWRAFEAPRLLRFQAARMGWTLLLLSLWIGSGIIPQIHLALLAGVALLAMCTYSIRETSRSKVLANAYKARVVSVMGFFMLAPLARALLHFAFGMQLQWPQ